jgi:hypothetical protein
MSMEPDGQHHVAHLHRFGLALVVGDVDQQRRQSPSAHQLMLQRGQRDVKQFLLNDGRAQGRVDTLARCNLQRQCRGAGPEQQFGKVVQQRGLVDHCGVMVHALHGDGEREMGRAVRARQDCAKALQRFRMLCQQVLHRRLRAEMAEERRDAGHHQGGSDGLGVAAVAAAAQSGDVCLELQRHQRIGREVLGQQVGVDRVLVGAQFFQRDGRARQHRQR